jgi:IS30 family transposase
MDYQNNYTTEKKKWQQISEKERYIIETLYKQGLAPVCIGKALETKRDRRTIERELKKGMCKQLNHDLTEKTIYLADVAQRITNERAKNKGRSLKIGYDHKLVKHIENKIINDKYSPDAVIGEIKAQKLKELKSKELRNEQELKFEVEICTKTVYNYIDKGVFLNLTNKNLPVKKNTKKRNYNKIKKVALKNTKGESIEKRPVDANERLTKGHFEIDLVMGKQGTKTCLLVLTDRMTRKEFIEKLDNKKQESILKGLSNIKSRTNIPFATITVDNGSEFLDFKSIETLLNCKMYYAHPFSSWERGSNENANKLIRRFIPKGINIAPYTTQEISHIETWINNYPRKIFNYKTANQISA